MTSARSCASSTARPGRGPWLLRDAIPRRARCRSGRRDRL